MEWRSSFASGNLSPIVSNCHVEHYWAWHSRILRMVARPCFYLTLRREACPGPNDSDLLLSYATINSEETIDMSSITVLKTVEQPFRIIMGVHLLKIGDNFYLWGLGNWKRLYSRWKWTGSTHQILFYFTFSGGEVSPVLQDN